MFHQWTDFTHDFKCEQISFSTNDSNFYVKQISSPVAARKLARIAEVSSLISLRNLLENNMNLKNVKILKKHKNMSL